MENSCEIYPNCRIFSLIEWLQGKAIDFCGFLWKDGENDEGKGIEGYFSDQIDNFHEGAPEKLTVEG